MLMRAAGASGDMRLVLVLAEEMRREGLTPCTVSELMCPAHNARVLVGMLGQPHSAHTSQEGKVRICWASAKSRCILCIAC